MKIKHVTCALSLLFLTSCGGDSSTDKVLNPVVDTNTSSSLSSAFSATKIIESVGSGELSTGTNLQKTLDVNKEKWSSRNINSYQYKYKVGCFCLEKITQNKQVTVFEGVITEAFYLQSSSYLTQEELSAIKTIDKLFSIVEQAIKKKAYEINVTYNSNYGYPERISINYDKNLADDEIIYYVSDLM